MHYVYILKSQTDGGYYYGSTADMEKRLKAHNAGRVRSTKHRRPLKLHYVESFDSKEAALKRERFFKSPLGYAWLKARGII
jgi:putative endonuclease